jgi:uncharacterized DUF497 family protein
MQSSLVEFEFDPIKSEGNRSKHGIDFIEAQKLWDDGNLVTIPSKYPDEPRYISIGTLNEKHWAAVFTERNARIRIISVRRARDNEKELYERNKC